ncbi:IS110 family transposase [Pseudopedobacter beijingensis]|uniref:IS110 family transposase n=1 Tax=Pseudopedobacter beijingensis TaxID=1207056 RepID=A0ABW4IA09_9SPHI
MLKYSLGIDISKKDFHACLSVINTCQEVNVKASRKFPNHTEGFRELCTWITKHRKESNIPLCITMEATGVYFEACALYLFKSGHKVSVVLPNKAKQYLKALGLKTKNDKIDASGLARMGAQQNLENWEPLDDFFYSLRALTRHHQSLQELKTNIKNQLHADMHSIYSSKAVIKQLKKLVATLDKQIEETAAAISKHISGNKEVAAKTDKIQQIKGIGIITIATVLAETNGFALFSSIPQLVSYAGYDVEENQSGSRKGKTRISKKGNSRIRRCLHLPAFNVVRYNMGDFRPFYERILSRHNQKMKAYVAVQKKLLVLIYTLWKKNEDFNPPAQTTEEEIFINEEMEPSFALARQSQINSPDERG